MVLIYEQKYHRNSEKIIWSLKICRNDKKL